jgi:hypothetical protein
MPIQRYRDDQTDEIPIANVLVHLLLGPARRAEEVGEHHALELVAELGRGRRLENGLGPGQAV